MKKSKTRKAVDSVTQNGTPVYTAAKKFGVSRQAIEATIKKDHCKELGICHRCGQKLPKRKIVKAST